MQTGLRRRSQEAHATRERILSRAVQIASVRGLAATSIGDLAEAVGMSKSGLFAHFASKEQLEIAVIDEAERLLRMHVYTPSEQHPHGVARLDALLRHDVSYCTGDVFEGGCFFAAAAHELDGREGPVRERLIAVMDAWDDAIRGELREAKARGEIREDVDSENVLFVVTGMSLATNWTSQLRRNKERATREAHALIDGLLANISTDKGRQVLAALKAAGRP
jgi:AcrR family transcriptional regulator